MGQAALVIVQVAATAYSVQQSRKAAKAQQRAADEEAKARQLQQKREELEAKKRKREVVRETLRQRARSVAAAKMSGIGTGSSVSSAAEAMAISQGASALGSLTQGIAFGRQIGAFRTQSSLFTSAANKATSNAATAAGVANLSGSLYAASSDFDKIFSYNPDGTY